VYVGSILLYVGFCVGLIDFAVGFCCPYSASDFIFCPMHCIALHWTDNKKTLQHHSLI